jgi:hypothetical protein
LPFPSSLSSSFHPLPFLAYCFLSFFISFSSFLFLFSLIAFFLLSFPSSFLHFLLFLYYLISFPLLSFLLCLTFPFLSFFQLVLFFLFDPFSLMWKNKTTLRSSPYCLFVCVLLPSNSWAESCPLYITSGRTAEKTVPPSVLLLLAYFPHVSVCVPLLQLLVNGSVNKFPRQRIDTQQYKNFWTRRFFMRSM